MLLCCEEGDPGVHTKNTWSISFFILCGYLFIYIERPWEVWPWLAPYRIERIYMLVAIGTFAILTFWRKNHFRFGAHPLWVAIFLGLHYALAPFAFLPDAALDQGFEYFKMVVFYLLIIWCISNELELRRFVQAYIVIVGIYMLHSFREYLAGRHFYRMGITRMIGVDQFANDPNAFAASLVFSLPFVWLVFKTENRRLVKWISLAYAGSALVCVMLTGSRSGFVTLVVFVLLVVGRARGWRLVLAFVLALLMGLAAWSIMPEEKRLRIETIWNPEVGPASAQQSAQGRMGGFKTGLRMFAKKPLTGIGVGDKNFIAYRTAFEDGSAHQAHNLAGELLGEMGVLGGFVFLAQIITSWRAAGLTRRRLSRNREEFLPCLAVACQQALVLLLISGLFGDNLYRTNWLWIGAWSFLGSRLSSEWDPSANSTEHSQSQSHPAFHPLEV